jgi:hypothetical protein
MKAQQTNSWTATFPRIMHHAPHITHHSPFIIFFGGAIGYHPIAAIHRPIARDGVPLHVPPGSSSSMILSE